MARNRKRAKERRARRPQPVVGEVEREEAAERPESIRHAAPDVEIAEAHLALGRPELGRRRAGRAAERGRGAYLPAEADLEEAEGEALEKAESDGVGVDELEYELESTPSEAAMAMALATARLEPRWPQRPRRRPRGAVASSAD